MEEWEKEFEENKDYKIQGPEGPNSFIIIDSEKLRKAQKALFKKLGIEDQDQQKEMQGIEGPGFIMSY